MRDVEVKCCMTYTWDIFEDIDECVCVYGGCGVGEDGMCGWVEAVRWKAEKVR